MLKKKLGVEAIERDWSCGNRLAWFFKIPSTLVLPESVEKIGYATFSGCTNATIILKKHKKDFKAIYSNSFADCRVVKKEIGN